MARDFKEELLNAIIVADRDAATEVVTGWSETHGDEDVISGFIEPVLRAFGEYSKEGSYSLAQGYLAAKLVEDTLDRIADRTHGGGLPGTARGPVVVGNIEDDFHGLGRRLLATFLRSSGWDVIDMGDDVTAEEFVDMAVERGARIIGASAMMYTTAMNIKTLRREIDDRGLTGRVQLAVGGAVFVVAPELVKEVGGDGTSTSAAGAPQLMAELWEKAEEQGALP